MANEIITPPSVQEPESEKLIICTFCSCEIVKECRKCKRTFCGVHAARFSPEFCKECFTNISAIVDKFIRSKEEYDPVTDTVITNRQICERLRLDGPDWVFYTTWIKSLDDQELQSVFEFHYFIVKLIEHDNEIRKISKATKLREKSPSSSVSTSIQSRPISVTTERVTKSRKESKPVDMRSKLKAMGIPDAVIEQMLKAATVNGGEK